MPRLRTLGGLSIDDAEQSLSGAALQRRRLAVLAVIAAAGSQGVSRDKLLGFFWPEVDEERARHSLAQTLYALRRALHADDLFIGATEIRVNGDCLTVDVWDFEQAVSAGDPVRAVGLYGGAFLDGVHIDNAPAFERWMESERDRLAHAHRRALDSLASAADNAADMTAAVNWWRQLAAVDPLSLRPALGLMRALAATGDSAAALRHARVYENLLRSELDVPLPAEVISLVERLRDSPAASASPSFTVTDGAEPRDAATARRPEHAARVARRPSTLVALVASIVLALLIAGVANVSSAKLGAAIDAADLDSNRVAIFPFDGRGDSATYLRDGMVYLLSAGLDSAGGLSVVDPRVLFSRVAGAGDSLFDPDSASRLAAGLGAGLFVLGDVTEVGGQVQITASLFNTLGPDKPVARSSVSGAIAATFDMVDRVAAELLAGRSTTPRERLARVAAVSTSSLPALKAYLAGERNVRAGSHQDALVDFQNAVALDSMFALAYYRLSLTADWVSQLSLAQSAAEKAARYADRLAPHDRLLVQALRSWRRNDIDDAERTYKLILTSYPDDVETWYQLGEVYFHNNPARGRSFVEARTPFRRALALEPDNKEVLQHLLRIAAWEQQWDTVAALLRRLNPGDRDVALVPFIAIALRDSARLERALAGLTNFESHGIIVTAGRVAVYARRLDVATRIAALAVAPGRLPEHRSIGYRTLASLAASRGRWREARAYADSLRTLSPHYGLETEARLANVPFAVYSREEIAALRDLLQRPARSSGAKFGNLYASGRYEAQEYPARLAAAAGLLAARVGDLAGVQASVKALETDRTTGASQYAAWRRDRLAALRAERLRAEGRITEALAALTPINAPDEWGSRDEERWLLGQLAREAGRLSDAVRWFSTFEHQTAESLPWAAPAHFARAELLQQLGRNEEAAISYDRVVELWRDCDEELRPRREEARSRARRLRR